jgi:hypothetical protein
MELGVVAPPLKRLMVDSQGILGVVRPPPDYLGVAVATHDEYLGVACATPNYLGVVAAIH